LGDKTIPEVEDEVLVSAAEISNEMVLESANGKEEKRGVDIALLTSRKSVLLVSCINQ
jgi:hypothetical protein